MLSLRVNGTVYSIDVEPDTPLLWVIRDTIGLTGTKFGCGMALCGACTVHVNGKTATIVCDARQPGRGAGEDTESHRRGYQPGDHKPANRREFMVASFAIGGGFALGLVFSRNPAEAAGFAAQIAKNPWEPVAGKNAVEISPWLVIGPDNTVTVRVAQSEMGQATFTSWSKMIRRGTGMRLVEGARGIRVRSLPVKNHDLRWG